MSSPEADSPPPPSPVPRRNIEIKARVDSLARLQAAAENLGARYEGIERQRDTYFYCRNGRLKLREIEGAKAQLIAYTRPDELGPKTSAYSLVPVDRPEAFRAALTRSLGVRVVVDKRRTILHYKNVRIHLDEVAGLGTFLEFEAVLDERHEARASEELVERMLRHFGIRRDDHLRGSYAELLEAAAGETGQDA